MAKRASRLINASIPPPACMKEAKSTNIISTVADRAVSIPEKPVISSMLMPRTRSMLEVWC